MKPMGEVKHNVQESKMRTTKKELKKIIQEEYQKVLKEYISEGQPELEPESWYDEESSGGTGKGASFQLGLFIVKLDKIQPGLGGELDKILVKLDAEEQAPSHDIEEALDPATEEALVKAIQSNPASSWLLSQDDPCKLGEAIKAIADKLAGSEEPPPEPELGTME